jgi:DNA-binding PadR family transcriptional regulator
MDAPARPPAPLPSLSSTAFHVLLAIGPEERHGYAIMREIERMTGGATKPGPGGIYTTIRRLLDDGLIEESDERPDADMDDQRRRYYRLTGTGRAAVSAETRRMQTLVRAASPWALETDG